MDDFRANTPTAQQGLLETKPENRCPLCATGTAGSKHLIAWRPAVHGAWQA